MSVGGWPAVGLAGAGVGAGIVGTAGGITSLVSYPALLAVGVGPLPANVANLVAAVACWPSSALASRRELSGSGRWFARTLPVAATAGGVGSLLLIATPPGAFDHIVPWLVMAGAVTLLLQPRLTRRRGDAGPVRPVTLAWWVAAVSVYGGYFGAGSGIMLLAVTMILYEPRLPHANAIKNMLVGAAAVASAVVFVVHGPVAWSAVLPLAAGLLIGSLLGPVAARRLPAAAARWTAAALGIALAVDLFVQTLT
jgi:uncharacterized membrane protein YfcA